MNHENNDGIWVVRVWREGEESDTHADERDWSGVRGRITFRAGPAGAPTLERTQVVTSTEQIEQSLHEFLTFTLPPQSSGARHPAPGRRQPNGWSGSAGPIIC